MEIIQIGLALVLAVGILSLKMYGYRAKASKDKEALRTYIKIVGPIAVIGCIVFAPAAFHSGKWYWILLWIVGVTSSSYYTVCPDRWSALFIEDSNDRDKSTSNNE